MNRRIFLRRSGLGSLPIVTGLAGLSIRQSAVTDSVSTPLQDERINFFLDTIDYTPSEYLNKLAEIHKTRPIEPDHYAAGGTMEALLNKFAEITGKEAAIYMPSGTLANQLALHVLCGGNTKIFVQEASHIYRDEADAAQTVFGKRLIPLAKGRHYFSMNELQAEEEYINKEEYFKSSVAVVSIENPVRRCDGKVVPVTEIRNIAAWCRKRGHKLHLDGARLHIASAYSGVPVREYASYFDTVYMCLYKYLGASAGAILCGEKVIISQMERLIKIHGGSMYQNWSNAAMALSHLDGVEERLKKTKEKAEILFYELNEIPGIEITTVPEGSNIFSLRITQGPTPWIFQKRMDRHSITIPGPGEDGAIMLHVNESLLLRESNSIVNAFKSSLRA